ncbi:MAG: hypothetical protein AAB497_01910 [Patescibacteria group bacterium]
MKHIGIFAGVFAGLAWPALIFAQADGGVMQALVGIEDQSKMLEIVSLWSMLVIAFATSVMVWVGGRKMHGGVFGKVLTYFSIGMTVIFLGIVVETPWFPSVDGLYLKMIHDSLYIIGYIMMGIAASKLLKVIKGE